MDFNKAYDFISGFLKNRLPQTLFYHDYEHTMSIVQSAADIAQHEGITDERDITLLKTAALFHDCGFANTYHNHEEEGCRIAKEKLPGFGYTTAEIEMICSMIMTTKAPQSPSTILEKILCDADLHYLGTDEFEKTGRKLYREWKERGKVRSEEEWNELQIAFLKSHRYWTKSCSEKFDDNKASHLAGLLKSRKNTA